MFSEYASRFLAQSQSRISNFVQQDNNENLARNHVERQRWSTAQPSRGQGRQYNRRSGFGNPYQPTASQLPNFPFTSRLTAAPDAPLFHSTVDEFREEDDEEEREREVADFFALQRSRRLFGASRLQDSSEGDDGASYGSVERSQDAEGISALETGRGRGIKSSWNGGPHSTHDRGFTSAPGDHGSDSARGEDHERQNSETDSRGKGKLHDVALESVMEDDQPDLSAYLSKEDSPPAFQKFRNIPATGPTHILYPHNVTQAQDVEALPGLSRQTTTETEPPIAPTMTIEPPKHDTFWGSLYLICMAALFSTFLLIFLHTSTPSKKNPIGDTIYTSLHSSFHLLAVDTVVSIVVSLLWLALLRAFVRPLVGLMLLAVPVILLSFSIYPFVSSYQGSNAGSGFQDRVMRWLSLFPGLFALLWVYTIYKGRHAFSTAVGILEFACKILAANPALFALGLGVLATVVLWTWMWLAMFTRVFLGGHMSIARSLFIIDASTWWLGIFFVLMYMWTLSVISGLQRTTTAATVSQWYFHRNVVPAPTSAEIVISAFSHSATTAFGTVCLHTLLSLLIRLPLLVMPKRLISAVTLIVYSFVPTPVAALLNPLSLTYAAIHSQPLQPSARALSQMTFLAPQAPTTTLTPQAFPSGRRKSTPLLPYRLAKLLLHATRFIMTIALGFGGWVATARQLELAMPSGTGIRGSAYAYVVGIIASFIGWAVLGAMEGILSGIVDASVVCWGSEKSMVGRGSYCLEAGYLFGEARENAY